MGCKAFSVDHNAHGALTRLAFAADPANMNWVIDPDYLQQVGYAHDDKLFGEFDIEFSGRRIASIDQPSRLDADDGRLQVDYDLGAVALTLHYEWGGDRLHWRIELRNNRDETLSVNRFSVWMSLAYVMFRDRNVQRNASQSAAVYPSISRHFTKMAAVRRDNRAPHLGVFQIEGEVLSIGTFNEFTNLFFENISPSLDGMLFHQLVLAADDTPGPTPGSDWIYPTRPLTLAPHAHRHWSFVLAAYASREDFYTLAGRLGHPRIGYRPMVQLGQPQRLSVVPAATTSVKSITVLHCSPTGVLTDDITPALQGNELTFTPRAHGEHEIMFTLADGREDIVVFNVMPPIREILRRRIEYLAHESYSGPDAAVPYSFRPLSVQGESLGKMNLILQTLLLDPQVTDAIGKVRQVENSAVHYVRNKWFIDGDFTRPQALYGDFYRVLDFDYISHLFFLLSQFPDETLALAPSLTYLDWAADVLNLRCNPALHAETRAKAETEIPGIAFLYVNQLLEALKRRGLTEKYQMIRTVWEDTIDKIDRESPTLVAAMTEHFYDNAGFGPAAGALALAGRKEAARRYSDLLQANIGFSNDFRAQNPDRWWEALSYMIHALWGGLPAAAALTCGVKLNRPALAEAAWRALAGIFYLYDWNATATVRRLAPGAAASTYSVAGPNLNRPDLSRNRFGQSIFAADGGIFARLFPRGHTGDDDWDCGEELAAYLTRFGQTTYLYRDGADVRVINGDCAKIAGTRYRIVSHAPYPAAFLVISTGKRFESSAREIIYDADADEFLPAGQ